MSNGMFDEDGNEPITNKAQREREAIQGEQPKRGQQPQEPPPEVVLDGDWEEARGRLQQAKPRQKAQPLAKVSPAAAARKASGKGPGLKELLEQYSGNIQAALPQHMRPERVIQVARLAVSQTPELQACDPITVVGAVVEASRYGLEVGGFAGHAYLIPRWNSKSQRKECTLQIGYKGLIELAMRSGRVQGISADVVYENDPVFEYEDGTTPILRHVKALKDRGEPIAAWAAARIKDGEALFKVVSLDEINDARARGGDRKFSPWTTDWDAMSRKTAIRRLATFLPMSAELQDAVIRDELRERGHDVPILDVRDQQAAEDGDDQ